MPTFFFHSSLRRFWNDKSESFVSSSESHLWNSSTEILNVVDRDPHPDADPYVFGLPDPHPDPLVTSKDPTPDPSIIKQK